nr:hypothetical protein [Bacillus sp. J33]
MPDADVIYFDKRDLREAMEKNSRQSCYHLCQKCRGLLKMKQGCISLMAFLHSPKNSGSLSGQGWRPFNQTFD